MPSGTFSLDAKLVGGRIKHHRLHDHYGAESTQFVAIEEAIGPWGQGTPIQYVIADLFARINALESAYHHFFSFTIDALIPPSFNLDAVIFGNAGNFSFTVGSWVGRGGAFSIDATVRNSTRFTLDSVLV
jgi:hypothetical protein